MGVSDVITLWNAALPSAGGPLLTLLFMSGAMWFLRLAYRLV